MLFKDNIGTDVSLGMNTTAGNFGFLGSETPGRLPRCRQAAQEGRHRYRQGELVRMANYKGNITNGWSARGGQTQSAYVVGGFAAGGDPCGSSSGSAVGVSAGFAAASLGPRPMGRLSARRTAPRCTLSGRLSACRPAVASSRSRLRRIPSVDDQDDVRCRSYSGEHGRLRSEDPYTEGGEEPHVLELHPVRPAPSCDLCRQDAGDPRAVFYNETISGNPPDINIALNAAIKQMGSLGAKIIDNADVPSAPDLITSTAETTVLDTDIKVDMANYLSHLKHPQIETLEDLINFNDANADIEFAPNECCQQTWCVRCRRLPELDRVPAGAGDRLRHWADARDRRHARQVRRRRAGAPDRGLRFVLGGRGRIPDRQRTARIPVERTTVRHGVHRPSVVRTDTDQPDGRMGG